jgi:glyoxylase-like metal-dependent hydrolase (beta-lactamase superfamily II)
MRRSFLASTAALVLSLVLLAAAGAQAQGLTKIAENVYAYAGTKDASPGHSYAANAGIVVGTDGVIVIDTLTSAKEGRRLLKDIRAVTKKPIKYVVTTHGHFDHSFGACVFTDLGATLVGHELDRDYLAKHGEALLKKPQAVGLTPQDLAGTRITLPSLTFTERLTIRLGGETVELIHLTPSHSAGSTLVYLPRQKVLFAGDILFTDFHPFLGEGDIPGWVKTLDFIQGMDVGAIVPGHGPLSTKKDVADMRDYILLFDAKAKELVSAPGAPKDPAALAAEMKKLLPVRSLGEAMIQFNLMTRYLPARN